MSFNNGTTNSLHSEHQQKSNNTNNNLDLHNFGFVHDNEDEPLVEDNMDVDGDEPMLQDNVAGDSRSVENGEDGDPKVAEAGKTLSKQMEKFQDLSTAQRDDYTYFDHVSESHVLLCAITQYLYAKGEIEEEQVVHDVLSNMRQWQGCSVLRGSIVHPNKNRLNMDEKVTKKWKEFQGLGDTDLSFLTYSTFKDTLMVFRRLVSAYLLCTPDTGFMPSLITLKQHYKKVFHITAVKTRDLNMKDKRDFLLTVVAMCECKVALIRRKRGEICGWVPHDKKDSAEYLFCTSLEDILGEGSDDVWCKKPGTDTTEFQKMKDLCYEESPVEMDEDRRICELKYLSSFLHSSGVSRSGKFHQEVKKECIWKGITAKTHQVRYQQYQETPGQKTMYMNKDHYEAFLQQDYPEEDEYCDRFISTVLDYLYKWVESKSPNNNNNNNNKRPSKEQTKTNKKSKGNKRSKEDTPNVSWEFIHNGRGKNI